LAIVSNSQRLFTVPELKKFGIFDFFDSVVFSSDVGVCKPEAAVFLRALDNIEVRPQNSIYIGDNIFDDVYGAKKVGMTTVWINRGTFQSSSLSGDQPPDYEVKNANYVDLEKSLLGLI
jgi:putative hydrolase of the HAD superfamily